MRTAMLPDDLWDLIDPLLTPPKANPKGGRPRLPDRACLRGILFDAESIRRGLRIRGIKPWLAKRNTEHGSGLGRWRWVIE
jgi:hypothetical protein